MPVSAYILITTLPGKYGPVVKDVLKLSGVKQAHAVTGICDAVAYVEVPDLKTLRSLLDKLHAIHGIRTTRTGVVI